METLDPGRQDQLRELIAGFLQERLADKHDGVAPDDPKHAALRQQFDPPTWLADAAKRVGQLQAVTHSLKPLHPKAEGTSLCVAPSALAALPLVGSHCLGVSFDPDVVGNANALDVYKLLKLEHAGQSLLSLCEDRDPDLAQAFGADADTADAWMTAFGRLTAPRGKPASHTHAKQLYWLAGTDPHDDSAYHLLAPLYPTSLAHRVYATVQDDRPSDAAKAARQARTEGSFSARAVHEYTDLAIQQLGGANPQNIGQLIGERRGKNLLLASLPPSWRSQEVRPLLGQDSLFDRFGKCEPVRERATQMRQFLDTDPPKNQHTRARMDEWVDTLIDELLYFSAELRTLPPGWSQVPECQLSAAQCHWLDPTAPLAEGQSKPDAAETADTVAGQFANWLNGQLRDSARRPLPVGDDEGREWKKRALEQIGGDDWEAGNDE